ncbi:MAG: DNA gyrase inhibitor YacG [Nitrosospira sp.]|nr:DNA gyrase inhibitor YacG [Nitrosospira sp.]
MKEITVNCPQCKKTVIPDTADCYLPFCSEHCKMIDLGKWVTELYRIPEVEKIEDKWKGN